jgi:hypothetical protein
MTLRVPDADIGFFWAAVAQLDTELRPVFVERVACTLGAHPDPGPGDADRAVRQALDGLWVPPPIGATRAPPRWPRRHA